MNEVKIIEQDSDYYFWKICKECGNAFKDRNPEGFVCPKCERI